jgi:glyoxylase-like metal-dependent hydrolase (beta-lactamase superfamily II)
MDATGSRFNHTLYYNLDFGFSNRFQERTMPFRIQGTMLISEGFYLLNSGFVASYLLDAGGPLVAFDAGMNQQVLLAQMEKLNLDGRNVLDVFFTHSDPDHIGGTGAFPNAKAHLSKSSAMR